MRRSLALAVALLGLSACTQWGTSALRTSDVWWACTDRNERCSPEDAGLTLIQMDNTLLSAKHELGLLSVRGNESLESAVASAESARSRVPWPVYWGDVLADYVQATVNAERAARRARSPGIDW